MYAIISGPHYDVMHDLVEQAIADLYNDPYEGNSTWQEVLQCYDILKEIAAIFQIDWDSFVAVEVEESDVTRMERWLEQRRRDRLSNGHA